MFYGFKGQMWVPMAIPRHVPPQSVMTAPGLTAYAPHMGTGDQDSLAVHLAMSAFRLVHQRVTIINLPEFDWPLGHLDGGTADHWFAWTLMSRLDDDLAYIEAELKSDHVLGQTMFVLTADHGMETLNHTVPYESIESAIAQAGTSWVRYDFHTAAYLWLRDPGRAQLVGENIMRLNNPNIRAVYFRRPGQTVYQRVVGGRDLVPGSDAANLYLLNTMAGPTAPQVAVVLRANASVRGTNEVNWHGDHGGPNWGAQHIPLILSGPGIRRGVVSHYPASLTDIAPTVLHLLGASSSGMDGVALADAMLQPSSTDVALQTQRGRSLTPFVDALMRQAASDGP
jgi:arylsulfatase A-like enzyme